MDIKMIVKWSLYSHNKNVFDFKKWILCLAERDIKRDKVDSLYDHQHMEKSSIEMSCKVAL